MRNNHRASSISKQQANTPAPTTPAVASFERACDPCFNAAVHTATQIRKEEEEKGTPPPIAPAAASEARRQQQDGEEERQQHARNQAELGILNPSGRTSADPLGARRGAAAGGTGAWRGVVCGARSVSFIVH